MWKVYAVILLWKCATTLIGIVSAQGEFHKELIYVQAIWRHGDRAPKQLPYPNDNYNETAWPRGWGQVTNVRIFQKLYQISLPSIFFEIDVDLVSSKSDRAIVSGLAMLRGFFPAIGQEEWLQNEQWQPLLQVATTDAMLKPTSFNCLMYNVKSEKENEVLFKNISKQYASFFDFLANVTGYKKMNFKKATSLYNIQREIDHNMTQPSWVYNVWPQFNNETTISIISSLKRIRRISQFNSAEKARLRGGLLMKDWIDRARNVSLGLSHDGTLLALMYALGIGNDLLVPYASCAIMEIYKTLNSHTIMFFYKNGTVVHQLLLPGCSSYDNCTIAQVEKAVSRRSVRSLQQLNKANFF
ncbi:unnamed protein product [Brugia pahangi]|uniref:Lysosomal acid phosphatase n=1 Tax=Brugia pahangi TaxID=6280 RepID=A0A0N4TZ14_BRUPA|nr:unnamed protein product [Brugia pahangi]